MRKPVFPRILLIVFLYAAVFVLLVSVQFAKQGDFTMKVGNFVVSGQYRKSDESGLPRALNEYYLDGDVHVFFGGMDFGMVRGNEGRSLCFEDAEGRKEETLPERMIISENAAHFLFPGGTELEFVTQYAGGAPEMRIIGVFSEDVTGIELPFKPQRRAGIRDAGNDQFIVIADGKNYSFGNSPMDAERRILFLSAEGKPISYRAIPERKSFSLDDYILPKAATISAYNESLTKWRDQNFSLWNRTVSGSNNEDVVVALGAEALTRGTYKAAVAAVSGPFLRGSARTHESSVYLGGLDLAYRSLSARDREKLARLSRQINEKSLEFLFEPRVFEYFAVRGHINLFDAGADLVRTIDPAILSLDIVPGILEGHADWKKIRPNADNPFGRLVDQACFVISEALRKTENSAGNSDASQVFVLYDGQDSAEFNMRLGKALALYAEAAQDETWAGIGRSIVLSALSQGDSSGSELITARLYRILSPTDLYPRAVNAGVSSIWAWTAARTVSASQQNDVLDIAVNFPAGEAHYMIIRGIRPFARVQLYDMDFRTDPQFERYDSSGWSYIPQEQTLIVKMKHRVTTEHIRIFYREEPEPAAESGEAEESGQPAASNGSTVTAPGEAVIVP